jgi:large subunit ribosomal protein L6
MSRIGRKPVTIPSNVKCSSADNILSVDGPLGKLDLNLPTGVEVEVNEGVASVKAPPKMNRVNRGYQGLVRALLFNMVEGVTKGYEKNLEISGVGYRCEQKGSVLTFSLGYSHTITLNVPEGITAEVDKNQTKVKIKGVDKQLVGQIAAKIRGYKKPEPYKGKGVKYADEIVRRKVGKSGAK